VACSEATGASVQLVVPLGLPEDERLAGTALIGVRLLEAARQLDGAAVEDAGQTGGRRASGRARCD